MLVGPIVCGYFLPFCKLCFFFYFFAVSKFINFIRSHLFGFAFASFALIDRSKKKITGGF